MQVEEKNGVTITIPKPRGMTLDRFLILISRLEKIVDELGGVLHVKRQ